MVFFGLTESNKFLQPLIFMPRIVLLLLFLNWGTTWSLLASELPALYTQSIAGRVYNQYNEPLQGASITIKELNLGTLSGADGSFSLDKLAPGIYYLVVSHMGYSAFAQKVELGNKPAWVELRLEPTYIELQEVVVRDQRSGIAQKEHSLNIAAVNREYLSEQPGMTLMQSLQRMPGVQAMNIGTGISKPVIRGMSFNRVIVAENNIKQQGQQWGSDHGLEIDPYGVERVEVIKGPATLLFGSDGIGGAINIRPPVIPQENTLQAEAIVTGKSNNDLIGTSVMSALNRNGNFFRVRASLQNYADYRVPADSFIYNNWIIPLAESRLKNTSGNDNSLAITAGIRRKWGISTITASNYSQKAGFFPGAHGVPNPSALAIAGNPRRTEYPMQKVNHLKLLWNSNIVLGKNWLEFDFGFQQNHRQELNPPHVHGAGPLPEGNTELELWLNTFSANIKLHQNISLNNVMVYGFSSNYQENKKGGYNFLLPDFRAADAGLFLINQRNLSSNFFFNAGLRADIAMVDIAGYEEAVWSDSQTISHYQTRSPEFSKSYINATANAGISWLFGEGWNLKTNLGSSYRTPNPIELSANGIHHGSFRHEKGDTSLRPERALQLDMGLIYNRTELYFALSPFVNYFTNYLFLNPSGVFSTLPGGGQIYRFEQARALHLGSEAYLDWHLTHKLHTSFGAEIIWAQNLDDNYPLPFIPPSTLSMELSYHVDKIGNKIGKTKLLASVRSSAAQNRVARNEPATGGYTLVNLGLSTKLIVKGFAVELDFHVQNIFDVLYQNHLSFYRKLELPEPGRNFSLTLRFPFIMTKLSNQ
jgi:iron complex outermembrane receptor protein